ncbi:2-hydroxychromene-2-carboxylate isomerase [Bradyrhizobium sp. i1.4.4]
MTRTAPQFLFDFGSPNAYLSHLAIPAIEQRIGVKFEYVPILLGGIFKSTNNKSPAETLAGIKNKREFHPRRSRPSASSSASRSSPMS